MRTGENLTRSWPESAYDSSVSQFVIEFRQRARRGASAPMFLWSVVMAVVLVTYEVERHGRGGTLAVGLIATALFGAVLGWRGRTGLAVVAPLFSWLVAWFPLVIASMVRHGVLAGLVIGFVTVTVGWFVIGGLELLELAFVASLVARLRGGSGPDVTIFGPGDGPVR